MQMELPDLAPHLTREELESGLTRVRAAPGDVGRLEMIVRRPAVNMRELMQTGVLDVIEGLVGDTWSSRPSSRTADGRAHPDMQLTIMNARVAALVAQHRDRWPLAGDQLYVDLDLSEANLPPGARLAIGNAVVEVTKPPHTGCAKFVKRYGVEAMAFVNSPLGRALRLRGLNARVISGGAISVGELVRKK